MPYVHTQCLHGIYASSSEPCGANNTIIPRAISPHLPFWNALLIALYLHDDGLFEVKYYADISTMHAVQTVECNLSTVLSPGTGLCFAFSHYQHGLILRSMCA